MNTVLHRALRFATFLLAAMAVLAAAPAPAHSYRAGDIEIGHPWARPTVAGQRSGGAFLSLTNRGTAAERLVFVASPAATSVELHTMTMDGDVMRMRQVGAIDIPPGQSVRLHPGGMHVMFMGLKAPLQVGQSVPLTLRFERAGEVTVEVKVEVPKAPAAAAPHGDHGHR